MQRTSNLILTNAICCFGVLDGLGSWVSPALVVITNEVIR